LRPKRKLVTGFSLGLLLGGVVWVLGTQLSQAQSTDPTPPPPRHELTGEALAEELGLELLSQQPPGCADYVVVEGPDVGYCLEGHVSPGLDSWEVGRRLAGIVPSDLDRQIFQLSYELAHLSLPAERERFEELSRQLTVLLEQEN
jgi:hypothetical protein